MKFSIIIPVYTSERYIRACVMSILTQSFTDFELLIIDDGSTDESAEICKRLTAGDSRVRVYTLPHGGVSRARNEGIRLSKGDYLLFADSDDTVNSDYLMTLASKISDEDICVFGYKITYPDGKSEIIRSPLTGTFDSETALCYYSAGAGNAVWNKAFKRSFVNDANLRFDETISMGEDLLFSFTALTKTDNIGFISDILYSYVQHPGTLSAQVFTTDDLSAVAAHNKTRELLMQNPRALSEFDTYITETHLTNLKKICSDKNLRKSTDLKTLKAYLSKRLLSYLKSSEPTLLSKLNAIIMCISPKLWILLRGIKSSKKHGV